MGTSEFNAGDNPAIGQLASHPGGSTNTPRHFMLQKLKAGDRDAHKKEGGLACKKAGGVRHLASSSLYETKNAVNYFQISLFIPEIFKFLKHAN